MEGLTAREVREHIREAEEIISVLEWCSASLRELLSSHQTYIQLGDRRVSAVALLSVEADLGSLIGAQKHKVNQLDNLRVAPAVPGGDL